MDVPRAMRNPNEGLKWALHRVVTAIVTLESSEGDRSREAYSELVTATCHAKKILQEIGLPLTDQSPKPVRSRSVASGAPTRSQIHTRCLEPAGGIEPTTC